MTVPSRGFNGQVATDESGRAYTISVQNPGATGAVLGLTGALIENVLLSRPKQRVTSGVVATDPGGDALFAWTRTPHTGTLRVQVRERSAAGVLGPIVTASNLADNVGVVAVGMADDGSGLILESDTTANQLVVRYISPSGVLGPTEVVASAQNGFLGAAAMHEFPNGNAAFAWNDEEQNLHALNVAQASYRQANGTWGPTYTLSNPAVAPNSPLPPVPIIAGNRTGTALITWGGWDGSASRVRVARISSSGISPVTSITAHGQNDYPTSTALADDGTGIVAWRMYNAQTNQSVLRAAWVYSDGTHSQAVSLSNDSNQLQVELNGVTGAWLVYGVISGTHSHLVDQSFARDGTLTKREIIPAPRHNLRPTLFFTAGGPGGELIVTYSFIGTATYDYHYAAADVRPASP